MGNAKNAVSASENSETMSSMPKSINAQQERGQAVKKGYRLESRMAIMTAFGVGKETVAEWRRMGAPIVKIGRRCRADYEELWAWLVLRKLRG